MQVNFASLGPATSGAHADGMYIAAAGDVDVAESQLFKRRLPTAYQREVHPEWQSSPLQLPAMTWSHVFFSMLRTW